MRMTLRDWLLLLFLSMLWGGSFFFVAVAVRDLPPLTVVICRTSFAALALALVLWIRRDAPPLTRPVIVAFLTMGLLNNVIPFSLLFWGQTSIPSGLASILIATMPIFSIVVAHFALADERMAANKVCGIGFGFAGVVVLMGADLWSGFDAATVGMLACLGAALFYGFASVYGRRFRAMNLSPLQVASGQLTSSTLMMIPIVAAIDAPWQLPMPGLPAAGAVIGLALLSSALAYVVYFRLLGAVGAVNVSLVTLLTPVSAILLGTLFLGESLKPQHYAGMALIAVGLLAIDGRLIRRAKGNRGLPG